MINQILAILWKEWKELFQQRGLRGGLFNWLVLVVLGGLFVPLQTGEQWFVEPVVMLTWSWIPMLAVMQVVADTFAGERERHTLETLLASRLSDQAILWGKVLYVVLYGWSIEIASLLLAAVAINISHWNGVIQFYSAVTLLGIVPLSMLLVVLIAGIGTLVSLRSTTVRGAYQKMMIGFMIILFGSTAVIRVIPGVTGQINMADIFKLSNLLFASAVLLLVDLILITLGASRFRRESLIAQI